MTIAIKPNKYTPRSGSFAKACTETITPERTKKVPKKHKANVIIASINVHPLNASRFSHTIRLCKRPVAASHGNNDAFSTGSQNHQPPHPNSRYAHQLPSTMPQLKKDHGMMTQGRQACAQFFSNRPSSNTATAKAKAIANPT